MAAAEVRIAVGEEADGEARAAAGIARASAAGAPGASAGAGIASASAAASAGASAAAGRPSATAEVVKLEAAVLPSSFAKVTLFGAACAFPCKGTSAGLFAGTL